MVVAGLGDVHDGAARLRIEHHLVLDERVLLHDAEYVAAGHVAAHAHIERLKVPLLAAVERLAVDTARNVDALEEVGDVLERTLDAVEDAVHDARAELDGERLAGLEDRIADRQAGRLLVDLNGGQVALEANDLAHELQVADAHQLVHGTARHLVGHHHCQRVERMTRINISV